MLFVCPHPSTPGSAPRSAGPRVLSGAFTPGARVGVAPSAATSGGALLTSVKVTAVDVLGRLRRRSGASARASARADAEHLATWAKAHRGVEAFVEQPSEALQSHTVVLVAHDGQWTRRRVAGAAGARRLGEELVVPVYDVQRTGYPQRMRDHEARERILRLRARRAADLE